VLDKLSGRLVPNVQFISQFLAHGKMYHLRTNAALLRIPYVWSPTFKPACSFRGC
jgi:hypothetical protein